MRAWPLLLLVACAGDDSVDTDAKRDTDPVVDDTAEPSTDPLAFVVEPSLAANPHGAGLTALLTLETSRPTVLELQVVDPGGTRSWTVDEAASSHEVLVLGLRPDAENTVTVTARDGDEVVVSPPLAWRTDPLPEGPLFEVEGDATAAEPGLTLLGTAQHLWMLDGAGEVVWYLQTGDIIHEATLTARGTVQFQEARTAIREVRLSGEEVRRLVTSRVAPTGPVDVAVEAEAFHHDVFESSDGHLWTLGIEGRLYDDYPISLFDPSITAPTASVAGDLVLEVSPDGQVVSRWAMLDLLDPYRIGYDMLSGDFWAPFFPGDDILDWSHGNGVVVDEQRDEVVVSLRHQDAVVGLDRTTGAVVWIFAPDSGWNASLQPLVLQPALPSDLPAYHQHAAHITPEGHLLMFDNGNERASAYEPPIESDEDKWSRCLEVSLDHQAGTWTTVWSWGDQLADNHFSGSLGDCDLLSQTGHRLITFGNLKNPSLPGARVYEVSPAGEIVWQLSLQSAISGVRPTLYRAERIAGVIPGR